MIAREIVINDTDSALRYKLTKRQTQEEVNFLPKVFCGLEFTCQFHNFCSTIISLLQIQKCTNAIVITRYYDSILMYSFSCFFYVSYMVLM